MASNDSLVKLHERQETYAQLRRENAQLRAEVHHLSKKVVSLQEELSYQNGLDKYIAEGAK